MATVASLSLPEACLFDAVVQKDYERLLKLYASIAKNSVASYLSMRNRWANLQQQQDEKYKSGK